MTEFTDFTINLNLDSVQAWDGKITMIAEGTYVFSVQHAQQTETSTGNPCVKFTFEVVDDSAENGKTLIKSYPLIEKSLGRFKALMQAIKVDPNQVTGSALLRKRFIAEIKHGRMPDQTAADGTAIPGKPTMDLRGERPVDDEAAVEVATPTTAAAAAPRKEVATAKVNGQTAARR